MPRETSDNPIHRQNFLDNVKKMELVHNKKYKIVPEVEMEIVKIPKEIQKDKE